MKNENCTDLPKGDSRNNAQFLHDSLPRGLALFLGGFGLLNVLGNFRVSGFNANVWWIDLRWLPDVVATPFLVVSVVCLLACGLRLPRSVWRRVLTVACAGLLGIAALANTTQFFVLLKQGAVHAGMAIPLSLLVATALASIVRANLRGRQVGRAFPQAGLGRTGPREAFGVRRIPALSLFEFIPHWQFGREAAHGRDQKRRNAAHSIRFAKSDLLRALAVCAACGLAFPLAQMFCFGKTDYRRPADLAVVLGARVYADGRPSDALADRVRTACQLYREGLVGKLLFSGGPGDGKVHETESMKRLAIQLGVNPRDILLDEAGLNTQATV